MKKTEKLMIASFISAALFIAAIYFFYPASQIAIPWWGWLLLWVGSAGAFYNGFTKMSAQEELTNIKETLSNLAEKSREAPLKTDTAKKDEPIEKNVTKSFGEISKDNFNQGYKDGRNGNGSKGLAKFSTGVAWVGAVFFGLLTVACISDGKYVAAFFMAVTAVILFPPIVAAFPRRLGAISSMQKFGLSCLVVFGFALSLPKTPKTELSQEKSAGETRQDNEAVSDSKPSQNRAVASTIPDQETKVLTSMIEKNFCTFFSNVRCADFQFETFSEGKTKGLPARVVRVRYLQKINEAEQKCTYVHYAVDQQFRELDQVIMSWNVKGSCSGKDDCYGCTPEAAKFNAKLRKLGYSGELPN